MMFYMSEKPRASVFLEKHANTMIKGLDFLTLAFGAYTILKFFTGIPPAGPDVVLTGGGAGGSLVARAILENFTKKK